MWQTSNSCVQLTLALLLDRGGALLVEEYTYPHMLEGVVESKGYSPVSVPMDGDGYIPAALRQVTELGRRRRRPIPHSLQSCMRGACGAGCPGGGGGGSGPGLGSVYVLMLTVIFFAVIFGLSVRWGEWVLWGRQVLDARRQMPGLPQPRILYTVPTGQNPTGAPPCSHCLWHCQTGVGASRRSSPCTSLICHSPYNTTSK